MINASNVLSRWSALLKQISYEVLTDPEFADGNLSTFLSIEQQHEKWLGFLGASEDELLMVEQRLGCPLPPSYRTFLTASNGFGPISPFIWRLKNSTEIDWLVKSDEELIKIWEESIDSEPIIPDEEYFQPGNMRNPVLMRAAHLRGCLMVSDWGDAGFLALNPAVQHNGEWEAWDFANWHPGAVRYRSFAELIQETLRDYQEIKAQDDQT